MDEFRELIRKDLFQLPEKGRVLFAVLTSERLYPNYLHFEKLVGWGDHEVLSRSISLIYEYLIREDLVSKDEIQNAIGDVDSITPHTEDFPGITTSFALDACTSVYSTLNYLLDQNIENIVDVATYARDTVDLYIQEKENLNSADFGLETKIAIDPFMIAEKKRQRELIKTLRAAELSKITDAMLKGLRNQNPIINLDLLQSETD